jgi:alkanesulfonate monooxygenase SsuD/methylene tetrahydromethanopterin reductase-like flavin-dependent oxidoreductase (luciferase family)
VRVGLYVPTQHPTDVDPAAGLDEALALARLAVDGGFSSLHVGQHFLSQPYWMFQPIPLLARLAAEAPGLELGLGVLLVPLLNPVEVAESVVTLDLLTDGRLLLGVGLGYRREEFDAFDVGAAPVRVYEEKLAIVRALLAGEAVTARGRGYRLDGARLALLPRRPGGPPIWMAAVTESGVRRAARLADGLYLAPMPTIAELADQVAVYRRERGDRSAAALALREVCVAETDAEAVRAARPHLEAKYATYARWGQDGSFAEGWDRLAAGRFLVGAPETVLAGLHEHRERLGLVEVVCRVAWPGLSPVTARRSAELLAAEVLPRLASKP